VDSYRCWRLAETTIHNKNGLICKPEINSIKNAIETLITDTKLYNTISANIKDPENNYSWQNISDKWLVFIDGCLKNNA